MISGVMPYKEIVAEVKSDWSALCERQRYYERRFLKEVSKAKSYPFTKVYKLGTNSLNNTYYLGFTCLSPKNTSTIFVSIAIKAVDLYGEALLLYNPYKPAFFQSHFIERYKERVMKDVKATFDSTVESLLTNEIALSGCEITKELEDVFHCFDGHFSEDKVDLLLTNSYGYNFAEKRGNMVFVKTVITPEMLSDRQKELFFQIKAQSDYANSSYYSNSTFKPGVFSGWMGLKRPKG